MQGLRIDDQFKSVFDLKRSEAVSEGSFGCVLKVPVLDSRTLFGGSEFIALKVQLPFEEIDVESTAEEALLTREISQTRDPGLKNPFIALTYDTYSISASDTTYETIIRITQNRCPRFNKLLTSTRDAVGSDLEWIDFVKRLKKTRERGDTISASDLSTESLGKWRFYEEQTELNTSLIVIELEFIGGGTLKDFTYGTKDIPFEVQLKAVMLQLTFGMYSLQREFNLLHKDIKPANILYSTNERRNLTIRSDSDNLHVIALNGSTPHIFISDFGVSEKVSGSAPVKDWVTGSPLYNAPTLLLIGPLDSTDVSVKSLPERGPDSDVWMLGNMLVALALHGWKMPPNVLGLDTFSFSTVSDLFRADFRERNIKPYQVPVDFAKRILERASATSPFVQRQVKMGNIKPVQVVKLIALCQFQKFMGHEFIPSPEDRKLGNSCYSLSPIAAIIADNEEKIMETGRSFILNNTNDQNIFEMAVSYIRTRLGEDGFEFIKSHLGWMPKQRRVSPFDPYEHGAYLAQSIEHKFFDELRTTRGIGIVYGYDTPVPKPKQYEPLLVLGKTLDDKNQPRLYIAKTDTTKRVAIYSGSTNLPICGHRIERGKLVRWLEQLKESDQHVCPVCEFSSPLRRRRRTTFSIDEREYQSRKRICEREGMRNPLYADLNLTNLGEVANGTRITVVDDSVLCGGTKSRFLERVLESEHFRQYREYLYVSNPYGGAQIALAVAVIHINSSKKGGIKKRAVIFVNEKKRDAPFVRIVEYLKEKIGRDWIDIRYESLPYNALSTYSHEHGETSVVLKPGFDYEESLLEIERLGSRIKEATRVQFDEVWVAAGSGTLVRGLQRSQLGKKYYALDVIGARPPTGNAIDIPHNQPFEEPVAPEDSPPFLSASRYDAKLWQHVKNREGKGELLLWNVM